MKEYLSAQSVFSTEMVRLPIRHKAIQMLRTPNCIAEPGRAADGIARPHPDLRSSPLGYADRKS